MTRIDEIMAAAYAPAASAAEGRSFCPRLAAAELRSLITQAIAEARADGALEMRETAAAEIERLRDELALCCQLKREYQEQAK